MSQQESKAPPPSELSLKYMAWDVKQLAADIKIISAELQKLNFVIKQVANALLKKGGNPNLMDDIPF